MAKEAGFEMLNREPYGKHANESLWARIADAFAPHFRELRQCESVACALERQVKTAAGSVMLSKRTGMSGMRFERITVDPEQMGGLPCIRRLRIPVATVVGMVADGMSNSEILAAYPDLEAADIREALKYAAEAVRERELPIAVS